MFPWDIFPSDVELKAWAKEGRDCGICVATLLAWLRDMPCWLLDRSTQRIQCGGR